MTLLPRSRVEIPGGFVASEILISLPRTTEALAFAEALAWLVAPMVTVAGLTQQVAMTAFDGDASWTGYALISGHW